MEQTLNDQLLQAAIQVMIAVLIPVVGTLVSLAIHQVTKQIKANVSADQLAVAGDLVKTFVNAAEQYNLGGILKQQGVEKKAWVVGKVTDALAKQNIHLDVGLIADMVEAKVLEEINKPRLYPDDVLILPAGSTSTADANPTVG